MRTRFFAWELIINIYKHYLAYWKEDGSKGNATSNKGDRGIQGKRGATGGAGPSGGAGVKRDRSGDGPPGPKGERGVAGVQGEKGNFGSCGPKGEQGARELVGPVGPKGMQGVQGTRGDRGPIGTGGDQVVRGSTSPVGFKSVQGVQGAKGDLDNRGEHGVKGEKGIQGDNSDVLSVLAEHLPIQLATRYGEKICFIKYHVSKDRSSIIDVGTLRSVSAYHEPAWHSDAKFVSGHGHEMANVQKVTGHFLEMKNSAYHCPYDLASNKVNAIYIVYKIRKYDSTGMEHNYLFSFGMGDNHASSRMKRQ